MKTILRYSAPLLAVALVGGCARSNAIQTSADTMIVQTRAAPICGGAGAANVAQKQAAIETLKAGYDRYVIFDAASQNTVQLTQLPGGTYQTTGNVYRGGGFDARTTYTPGPTIVTGGHNQAFVIKMFREGDYGSEQAVPARQVLGDKWQEMVKAGTIMTCT